MKLVARKISKWHDNTKILEEMAILYRVHLLLYLAKWLLIQLACLFAIHPLSQSTCYVRWTNQCPTSQSDPPTFSEEQTRNVVRAACHSFHVLRRAELDTGVFIRFYVPLPLLRAIAGSPKSSLPGTSSTGKKPHQVTERWRTPICRNFSNNNDIFKQNTGNCLQEFSIHYSDSPVILSKRSLKVGCSDDTSKSLHNYALGFWSKVTPLQTRLWPRGG